jgi:hypothetical protein
VTSEKRDKGLSTLCLNSRLFVFNKDEVAR